MKSFLTVLAVIVGLFVITFLANEYEIFGIRFWGVRKENARREVFEQTQSYVEGKRQELTKYRLEYIMSKDSTDKQAIKETILQSFANFDDSKLPPDLYQFLHDLKNN
jgi:hypothetical protein